jgi:TonB-linked SusC/RagA family outer membrane protein
MKTLIRILAFMLLPLAGYAQGASPTIRVTGTVLNEEGTPMSGVTVVVKGTSKGTSTGAEGGYEIQAPADGTLVFSFLGMATLEEPVKGRAQVDVRLADDAKQIDEVVVTAMGIKKAEKALGYSVSKVSGDDMNGTGSGNWLNSLSGKVAGLNFDQSSSGPGGSVRVTLRGEGSLSHDKNTALFVIDGVPVNSDITPGSNAGGEDIDGPVDFGGGAGDINPDDIESMSVLKGPAATALYGSRAANGAIIITTKSGNTVKGLGITVSHSTTFEQAGFWPDFQHVYGPGWYERDNEANFGKLGIYTTPREFSWWGITGVATRTWSRGAFGEKYDAGKMRYMYESLEWRADEKSPWNPGTYTLKPFEEKDWYQGFFETGVTHNTSITLDYNNGKGGTVRFSFKNTMNDWMVPNTGFTTQNINLSLSQKFNKYITFGTKATYYRKNSDNLPMSGYNTSSPLFGLVAIPTALDMSVLREEYFSGRLKDLIRRSEEEGLSTTYQANSWNDNLYFQVYEQLNTQQRDRFYGNSHLILNLIPDKLTLMGRMGIDWSTDFRTSQWPFSSASYRNGRYREQLVNPMETNLDFLLTYNDSFLEDFTVNASAGGNMMYQRSRTITQTAPRLFTPNVFQLQNSDGAILLSNTFRQKAVNSLFGVVSLDYKEILFLELTGRNDWSSTLALNHNSYFYPSVNVSILADKILNLKRLASWVSLVKIRASWANVGNDTDPYQLQQVYANSDFVSAYKLSGRVLNPDLKPENVESYELGLDMRFFGNRLGVDLTLYDQATTNQIIDVPSDWSTGFSSQVINAGKVTNTGVEVAVRVQPFKAKGGFNWTMNLTWSKNWNQLVELAPGVELWQLNARNTVGNNVFVYAKPGTELGRIYGFGYKRAPEGAYYVDENGANVSVAGQVLVDKTTGFPIMSEELQDFGSIFPDWKAGMTHSFSYKNLTLNLTFAGQVGGYAYSVTNQALSSYGKLTNSLEGRYDGLVHPGVNQNADGTYTANRTITSDIVRYYNSIVYINENAESNVFETSYLKMKELRLDYTLPKKLMKKVTFVQSISVGTYVTNLFCLTTWPQFDPEVAAFGGGSLNRGVETGAFPMTRTYGFNVKVAF